jgi:hypothetical protein
MLKIDSKSKLSMSLSYRIRDGNKASTLSDNDCVMAIIDAPSSENAFFLDVEGHFPSQLSPSEELGVIPVSGFTGEQFHPFDHEGALEYAAVSAQYDFATGDNSLWSSDYFRHPDHVKQWQDSTGSVADPALALQDAPFDTFKVNGLPTNSLHPLLIAQDVNSLLADEATPLVSDNVKPGKFRPVGNRLIGCW